MPVYFLAFSLSFNWSRVSSRYIWLAFVLRIFYTTLWGEYVLEIAGPFYSITSHPPLQYLLLFFQIWRIIMESKNSNLNNSNDINTNSTRRWRKVISSMGAKEWAVVILYMCIITTIHSSMQSIEGREPSPDRLYTLWIIYIILIIHLLYLLGYGNSTQAGNANNKNTHSNNSSHHSIDERVAIAWIVFLFIICSWEERTEFLCITVFQYSWLTKATLRLLNPSPSLSLANNPNTISNNTTSNSIASLPPSSTSLIRSNWKGRRNSRDEMSYSQPKPHHQMENDIYSNSNIHPSADTNNNKEADVLSSPIFQQKRNRNNNNSNNDKNNIDNPTTSNIQSYGNPSYPGTTTPQQVLLKIHNRNTAISERQNDNEWHLLKLFTAMMILLAMSTMFDLNNKLEVNHPSSISPVSPHRVSKSNIEMLYYLSIDLSM